MCFEISEVSTPSPLLQHPSSRVHVQLQHVEHPGVLLCTSNELIQVNLTCGTKRNYNKTFPLSTVALKVHSLHCKYDLTKCLPSPSLSTARNIRSTTSSTVSCESLISVFVPFFSLYRLWMKKKEKQISC